MKKSMMWAGIAALLLGLPGCGGKQVDSAVLEGNHWVLSTMNGAEAGTLFSEQMPTIDFNFTDSTVYGYSGCNRFTGGFRLVDGKLQAPHMASTRMACPDMEHEDEFLSIFAGEGAVLSLEKGDMLKLENEGIVLTFAPQAE